MIVSTGKTDRNNLKSGGLELFHFMWSCKTEKCGGSLTAVQCFRKAKWETKKFSESLKWGAPELEFRYSMILLYRKKCKHYWMFTLGERGRNKKKTQTAGMKKNSQVKTLSKLLGVSTKPIKNGEEILISKEESASIIRRYKTKMRSVRNLVKPKLAWKTKT